MPIPHEIGPHAARSLREAAVIVLAYAAATLLVAMALPGILGPLPVRRLTFESPPVVARTPLAAVQARVAP